MDWFAEGPKVHSRWLWVDGSRATYTHWHPGEPNDHGGNEDCTVMFPPAGKWNDGQCSSSLQHLCETNGRRRIIVCLILLSYYIVT